MKHWVNGEQVTVETAVAALIRSMGDPIQLRWWRKESGWDGVNYWSVVVLEGVTTKRLRVRDGKRIYFVIPDRCYFASFKDIA